MFLFSSSRESGKKLARSCEKRDSWLAQVDQVKVWNVRKLLLRLRNGIGGSERVWRCWTVLRTSTRSTTSSIQLAGSQPTLASFRSRRDAKRSCDEWTCKTITRPRFRHGAVVERLMMPGLYSCLQALQATSDFLDRSHTWRLRSRSGCSMIRPLDSLLMSAALQISEPCSEHPRSTLRM